MAGIYLHIPFCKKACHYCDFHFTTSLKYKAELLDAMLKEIELQRSYLGLQTIETVYFGGGTPSLIGAKSIQLLFEKISSVHTVSSDAEITLEANPDDLDMETVRNLKQTAINRFSIGVQSFFEEDLIWMNRAHNSGEAESSIKRVQDAGFENITIDLIYGYPLLTDSKWKSNLQKAIALDVPHISSYSMTVEPKTALASFINKGKQKPLDDNQSAEQYLTLMKMLGKAGFEHYETSNFAKPGSYSKHNTNYWRGIHYLGIGPSAHSFNGESRQWNVANNPKYIREIFEGTIPAEQEILSPENRVNEYIMTSLRTMWGMDMRKLEKDFGAGYKNQIEKSLKIFLERGHIKAENDFVKLTTSGKLFADKIASELFVAEELA
ncbi:MAG: radical SAM family heme chaperone HemW [Sphingobacteriaceae bacterium]|nr:radical SAM family heme chaperone HemW [Sphingobacteriaceae bacterium]